MRALRIAGAAGCSALLIACSSHSAHTTGSKPTTVRTSSAPTTPAAVSSAASSQASAPTAAKDFSFAGTADTPCHMTYGATADGRTITRVQTATAGELITHVGGNAGPTRNDMQITPGISAFTYDVPLNQVEDMGAILYVGTTEFACSIAAGS